MTTPSFTHWIAVQERKTRRGLLDHQTFSYCGKAYNGRFGLKTRPSRATDRPEAQRVVHQVDHRPPCRLPGGVVLETHDEEHVFADRHFLVDNASFGRQTGRLRESGPAWLTRKLPWCTVGFVVAAINQ
jgi:hypothetical protein